MEEKNRIRGKKSRLSGARFELRVRKKLEEDGWFVARWNNNVDLDKHEGLPDFIGSKEVVTFTVPEPKLINAKSTQFNRGTTGFPDLIAFKKVACWNCQAHNFGKCLYEVVGVECKLNGYLSKEEKEKCKWLLKKEVFIRIYVASKGKEKRGEVIYKELVK